ncbi:MAG: hypothetical protein ACP5IZ_09420 [Thermoprotei archaeon]|jgi:hypothetical protein
MSEIYDWSIEAGSRVRADKSTVNNIISTFQGNPNVDEAFRELVLYIARQASRNEINYDSARMILSHLKQIYYKYSNNKDMLRESVSKYLVLMKWVFECKESNPSLRDLRNFDEFFERLSIRR